MRPRETAVCSNCGEGFRGLRAFDQHQTEHYRRKNHRDHVVCHAPADRGLVADSNGVWMFPRPDEEDA